MRAALFHYNPPLEFATRYLHERTFDFKPSSLSMHVAPTRDFFIHILEEKIRATIKNQGEMIGWEDDNETVGPIALAAKESLLRAIPYMTPSESSISTSLYRLVLEHGDFEIHNTTTTKDRNGEPLVTSLYDWETACIVPALSSDPLVAVSPIDLIADEVGQPSFTRIPKASRPTDLETYAAWAQHYIEVRVLAGSKSDLQLTSFSLLEALQRSTRLQGRHSKVKGCSSFLVLVA